MSGFAKIGRWALLQGPTVLVLGFLGGIGYVGYQNDWTIPKFSELWSKSQPHEEESAIALVPDPAMQNNPDPCRRQFEKLVLRFPDEETAARAGLHYAPVQTRSMTETITATGSVDYDQTRIAHLSVPVNGFAWHVYKHLGDSVKIGDVLALVESPDVGKAKAEFRNYLVLYKSCRDRYRLLENSNSNVPEATRLEGEKNLNEAHNHLINAEQALNNLGLPVKIADAEPLSGRALSERMRRLGLPDSIAHAAEPKIISDNLIPLVAPFDGVVVGRDIVQGEFVGPAKPVQFIVADVQRMWVLLDVRNEDAARLRLGQEASFQPDGVDGKPAVGKVRWISTEVEEKTRTLRVRVEVENKDDTLRVHSFGTGRIRVRSLPNVLAVPDSAIQTKDNCHLVFVRLPDQKSFQTRLVELGISSDGFTQILSGVAAGEEVVTVGSHALKAEVLRNLIVGDD